LDIFPGHQQIELELSKVRQELKKSENWYEFDNVPFFILYVIIFNGFYDK
jgi:hypothetical protein